MPRLAASPARRLLAAAGIALAVVGATGCAGTVNLQPAPSANDPACAEVSVRLPQTVDGERRRWTDAQATGAWGSPASVIITCGVAATGPTTDKCITVGGVDWTVDESQAPRYLVTSYGRSPAVQVFLDNDVVSSNEVLSTLGPIVGLLPKTADCTDSESAPQ